MLLLAAVAVEAGLPDADVPYMPRAPEETEVTLPLAKLVGGPDFPAGALPVGPLPPPVRPGPPEGRDVVQVPDADGWLMLTVRAVMVPLDEEPVTTRQSPTATVEADAVVDWVKLVDGVQLTVTWPACWFWTSIEDPASDATDPTAPGNEPPDGAGPDPELAGATVVEDDADAVELAPQAARREASESPAATTVTRPRYRMFL